MKNVKMDLKGDMLTITVDLSKRLGPSASGKTTIIASTYGNAPLPFEEREEIVGLNIYIKERPKKPARDK